MAKIILKDKRKHIMLSIAEAGLLMIKDAGFVLLDSFFPKNYPESRFTRRLLGLDKVSQNSWRISFDRLAERGLLQKKKKESGLIYSITARGRFWVEDLEKEISKKEPPWDGKWRIISFDIPERTRKHRDSLRAELIRSGYQKLHNSVWVGKAPLPQDVFEFIREEGIENYIHLFLAGNFDKESDIKKLFG